MRGLFIALFLICNLSVVVARDSTRLINYWEVSLLGGAPIGSNAVSGLGLKDRLTYGFHLGLGHQFGKSDYGYSRRGIMYPSIGLSLTYLDASNINQVVRFDDGHTEDGYNYGRFLSLAFSVGQVYTQWSGGKWRLRSQLECGLAYAFNPATETNKQMLGRVGGHTQISFSYGLFVTRSWNHNEIGIGPQFLHMSNCNITRPNSGINTVALTLKYRNNAYKTAPRAPKTLSLEDKDAWYELNEHRWIWIFMNSVGWRSYQEPFNKTYTQYNVSVDLLYRGKSHSANGIGIDLFHSPEPDNRNVKNWWGISIMREVYYPTPVGKGMFAITGGVGIYLNGRHEANWTGSSRIYERVGLKYYLRDVRSKASPFIGFYIKGNLLDAEQFEVTYGWSLPR